MQILINEILLYTFYVKDSIFLFVLQIREKELTTRVPTIDALHSYRCI